MIFKENEDVCFAVMVVMSSLCFHPADGCACTCVLLQLQRSFVQTNVLLILCVTSFFSPLYVSCSWLNAGSDESVGSIIVLL